MKLVVFNDKHILDIQHDILYFDKTDLVDVPKLVADIKAFQPDLIIEEEKNDGSSLFTNVYKELPGIPKAWWMIDAHCNLIDHIVYAKQFDYVFAAQSWFIPIVQPEILNKVFYLPLCHTQTMTEYQEMLQQPVVERDIDFSFIGNIRSIHVERAKYVARLLEAYPETFVARKTDYAVMLTYLRRSKATFNCSLNNDLNFRVWEGLACGAMVVTDDVTDIGSITGLYSHVVTYDKLIPDWQAIGLPLLQNSVDFIKQGHTMTHRVLEMLHMIQSGQQTSY
jgi:hypothetical protein